MRIDWFLVATCAIVTFLLVGFGRYLYQEDKEVERLMAQCMDDGLKEYECEAMLRRGGAGARPVPMVVK